MTVFRLSCQWFNQCVTSPFQKLAYYNHALHWNSTIQVLQKSTFDTKCQWPKLGSWQELGKGVNIWAPDWREIQLLLEQHVCMYTNEIDNSNPCTVSNIFLQECSTCRQLRATLSPSTFFWSNKNYMHTKDIHFHVQDLLGTLSGEHVHCVIHYFLCKNVPFLPWMSAYANNEWLAGNLICETGAILAGEQWYDHLTICKARIAQALLCTKCNHQSVDWLLMPTFALYNTSKTTSNIIFYHKQGVSAMSGCIISVGQNCTCRQPGSRKQGRMEKWKMKFNIMRMLMLIRCSVCHWAGSQVSHALYLS